MITLREVLTEEERLLIITLLTEAYVRVRGDSGAGAAQRECEELLRKLHGTDVRLVAERPTV